MNDQIENPRYSDEELAEFKEIIFAKLAEAQKEYAYLIQVLEHEHSNDIEDATPTYKVLEEGSTAQSREFVVEAAARQERFIQGLQAALLRIENKTYGRCRITGKLIAKERLKLVPHTTLSVEGKQLEQQKR